MNLHIYSEFSALFKEKEVLHSGFISTQNSKYCTTWQSFFEVSRGRALQWYVLKIFWRLFWHTGLVRKLSIYSNLLNKTMPWAHCGLFKFCQNWRFLKILSKSKIFENLVKIEDFSNFVKIEDFWKILSKLKIFENIGKIKDICKFENFWKLMNVWIEKKSKNEHFWKFG